MDDILERLTEVFRDVFDDDELTIGPGTTARDIEGWDSLMHVNLLLNVEKKFHIRFSSFEVASLGDLGQLINLIKSKL